jgi:uncharacterized protein YneF (UPF0154 family)
MVLLKTLAVVIGLLALAFAGLGVRIWIRGRFTDTEVEANPAMRKLGIKCAMQEELEGCGQAADTKVGSCSSCHATCENRQ